MPSSGQATDAPAEPNTVTTLNLKFMPDDLEVPVGTTVRWVNGEAVSHTVTSGDWGEINKSTGLRGSQTPDGMFDHRLAAGEVFEVTFDEPGEYRYFCKPHLTMNGVITVTPSTDESSTSGTSARHH